MSVSMALVDYIPVACFLAAAVLLQRDLYNKMSKGAFALFAAGTIVVFTAGLFKATWKLLYALGICDFTALSSAFFPMQTTGFVLAAAGITAMLCHPQGKQVMYAAAPAVYDSKMIFVVLTVLSVAVLEGALAVVAVRRKKPLAVVLYGVSFLFVMGMGYLSTKDFANPAMNWLGEGVNIVGQGSFLLGALVLHRSGLAEPDALQKAGAAA